MKRDPVETQGQPPDLDTGLIPSEGGTEVRVVGVWIAV